MSIIWSINDILYRKTKMFMQNIIKVMNATIFVILKFVDPTRAMEYILYFMATRGTHACCHEMQNIFHGTRSTRGIEGNAVKNHIVTWYKWGFLIGQFEFEV